MPDHTLVADQLALGVDQSTFTCVPRRRHPIIEAADQVKLRLKDSLPSPTDQTELPLSIAENAGDDDLLSKVLDM